MREREIPLTEPSWQQRFGLVAQSNISREDLLLLVAAALFPPSSSSSSAHPLKERKGDGDCDCAFFPFPFFAPSPSSLTSIPSLLNPFLLPPLALRTNFVLLLLLLPRKRRTFSPSPSSSTVVERRRRWSAAPHMLRPSPRASLLLPSLHSYLPPSTTPPSQLVWERQILVKDFFLSYLLPSFPQRGTFSHSYLAWQLTGVLLTPKRDYLNHF